MGQAVPLRRGGSPRCRAVGLGWHGAWFVLACPQGPDTRVRKCPKSERAALQKCLDEERAGGAEQGTVKPAARVLRWGSGCGPERDGSVPWCRVVVGFVFLKAGEGRSSGWSRAGCPSSPPARGEDGFQGPKPATRLGGEEPQWVLPPARPFSPLPRPPRVAPFGPLLRSIPASTAHPGAAAEGPGATPAGTPRSPPGHGAALRNHRKSCLKENPPFPHWCPLPSAKS